jgi:hypothetical protein
MSDKDIVIQAREILAEPTMEPFLFGVTRDTFRALADEVETLRAKLNDPCLVAGYHVCGGSHNLSDLARE